MNYSKTILAAGSAIGAATLAFLAVPAGAATCTGNCGQNAGTPDGSIVPSPGSFGVYDWVSTAGGVSGAARIPGFTSGATNGSELNSDPFFAKAGQTVSFDFNYVTSDGSGFADYAFAQLTNLDTNNVINLFTARTKPSGTIVPGTDLPAVQALLTPAVVSILPGAPFWSPLGASSGTCYNAGCGYTGWIQSDYVIPLGQEGTYQLRFGVANWSDTAYQSGLAFSGLVLDGSGIGDGSAANNALLPSEINPTTGAFEFSFTASSPTQTVWIDPLVATGYDYVATGALITSATFAPGLVDANGYEVYALSGGVLGGLLGTVAAGGTFNFAGAGVSAFALRDIDVGLGLDPTNPTAFVTGLTFAVSGTTKINVSQTPITTFVPDSAVPEPATWAMMLAGFGLMGATLRRRKQQVRVRFAA